MALLGLLKKKKKSELDLPPPPKVEQEELSDISGIPDIRVGEELSPPPMKQKPKTLELPPEIPVAMPEFPEFPLEESEDKELSSEDMEFSPEQLMPVEQKVVDENVVFDKTVRPVEEQIVEVVHKTPVRKTFVSVDDYSTITESYEVVRSKLADAESLVRRLNELKIDENKVVDDWLAHLEDVEKKLAHVDKILVKAQS